jgi:hypothetical protein
MEMKVTLGVGRADNYDEGMSWTLRLVTKPIFEVAVSSVIMANVFIMAAQIQYQGLDIGHQLTYRWYDESAREAWVGAETAFDVFDYMFGCIYIVELLLKLHAYRLLWLLDPWNYFDALIVGFWLLEKPLKDVLVLPADATLLRTARLFKLLRLVKVIKTMQGFDSLYLLITTLKGSLRILGWSCVLLLVVQTLIALVIFFVLSETYFSDDRYPIEDRRKVFAYFGSFSRAMLSMFEMTLANWPPVCRLLVESVNEAFMIFFILHKLTRGFAVIGGINGVFMQETFKVASTDDSIMLRQKDREVRTYTDKMRRLFMAADESGDGEVDLEEFLKILGDHEIKTWLASMEIPTHNPESLFHLLDSDSTGCLTPEKMVHGALRLRGTAKSFDVLNMKKQLDHLQEHLVTDLTSAAAENSGVVK